MTKKKSKLPKHKQVWNKIRKKAPRVPDITCPAIDDVLNRLEKLLTTELLTTTQHKTLSKKLEKLRTANEQLRESGIYWRDTARELFEKQHNTKLKL
jgi:hypothetical protein